MTIFCYHSVENCWESPLAVTPGDFATQAAYLNRRREVIPLREAIPRLDRSGRLPRGVAALTFDDGFESLYHEALPVLQRRRLPATVFLVAQTLTEQGQKVDWVDTPGTEPLTTLSREQVLEMQDAGVDFQSHSLAHLTLTNLTFDECVRDLRESRELLGDVLGRRVELLAYPRGRHDEHVRQAAEKAGYSQAFTLPEEAERPGDFAIPRVGIFRGNSMTAMRVKAARPYLRLRLDPRFPPVQRKVRLAAAGLRSAAERRRGDT